MSIKFKNYVMYNEPTWDIKFAEPRKKQIKMVYKKQPRLSKSVVIHKPKLSFEKKENE
jgi:hypothetical protein